MPSVERVKSLSLRAILLSLSAIFLYTFFQPDSYGLFPNSLDPVFYTGYSISPDSLISTLGDSHYFVSRWIAYLPQAALIEVFGLSAGRLALRLALWTVLAALLWSLGRLWNVAAWLRLAGLVFVLTSPLLLRPLFTDYPEYLGVSVHMMLSYLVALKRPRQGSNVVVGLLCGCLLIVNPFNAMHVVIYSLVHSTSRATDIWRLETLKRIATIALAAVALVLLGLVYFRLRYGIANVYSPSIDYVLGYERPAVDPHVSTRNDWWGYFSWIYLGPVVALVSRAHRYLKPTTVVSGQIRSRLEMLTVSLFCAHLLYEIVWGHALESSIYFSSSIGPILLLTYALFLSIGSSGKTVIFGLVPAALWFSALLDISAVWKSLVVSGWWLLLVIALTTTALMYLWIRNSSWGICVFIGLVLWLQIGASVYTGETPTGAVNSPRYDLVVNDEVAKERELIIDEIDWLSGVLNNFKMPLTSEFVTTGGWASSIAGIYSPHPYGRWMEFPSDGTDSQVAERLRVKYLFGVGSPWLIYGPDERVTEVAEAFSKTVEGTEVLFNLRNPGGLRYRLYAIKNSNCRTERHLFPFSSFQSQILDPSRFGQVVEISPNMGDGFALFGPYLTLIPGRYQVTLKHSGEPLTDLGALEVFNSSSGALISSPLRVDQEGKGADSIDFLVEETSGPWEFRVFVNESQQSVLNSIELQRLSCD